jgi:hypothetical protein
MHKQFIILIGLIVSCSKTYGHSLDTVLVLNAVPISSSLFLESKISKKLLTTWDRLPSDPIGTLMRGADVRAVSPGSSITINRDGLPSNYTQFVVNGHLFQSPDLGVVDVSIIPRYGQIFSRSNNDLTPIVGSGLGGTVYSSYPSSKNSIQLKTSSIGSIGIGGSWSIFNPKPNQTLSVSLGHDTWTHNYTYYNYLGQKLKRLGANGERSEFNIFSRVLNPESNVWNSQSVYGISMSRGIPEPSTAAYRKGAEQTDNRIQLNNSIGWSKRNYSLEARQSVFYSHQSYTNVISDILDTNYSNGSSLELINIWKWGKFSLTNQSQFQYFGISGQNKPDTGITAISNLTSLKHHISKTQYISIYNKSSYQDLLNGVGGSSPGVQFFTQYKKRELDVHLKRIFRLPTMNDLFWSPGGNPNLIPESGWDLKASIGLEFQHNIFKIETFFGQLKNGIIWRPNGLFWQPINEYLIRRSGLNSSWKTYWESQFIQFEIQALRSLNSDNFPIPYSSPLRLRMMYVKQIQNGELGLTGLYQKGAPTQWTHERSSDLPDAIFFSVFFQKKLFEFKNKSSIETRIRLENLLNQQIVFQRNYPMPGRHINISLQINF